MDSVAGIQATGGLIRGEMMVDAWLFGFGGISSPLCKLSYGLLIMHGISYARQLAGLSEGQVRG